MVQQNRGTVHEPITVHFIATDFAMKSKSLQTAYLPDDHKGEICFIYAFFYYYNFFTILEPNCMFSFFIEALIYSCVVLVQETL